MPGKWKYTVEFHGQPPTVRIMRARDIGPTPDSWIYSEPRLVELGRVGEERTERVTRVDGWEYDGDLADSVGAALHLARCYADAEIAAAEQDLREARERIAALDAYQPPEEKP